MESNGFPFLLYFIIDIVLYVRTWDRRLNGSMDPTMSPKWDVSLPSVELGVLMYLEILTHDCGNPKVCLVLKWMDEHLYTCASLWETPMLAHYDTLAPTHDS